MTNENRKKLEKLQKEYNRLHERMGYVYNPATISAINKELDRICDKMNALMSK